MQVEVSHHTHTSTQVTLLLFVEQRQAEEEERVGVTTDLAGTDCKAVDKGVISVTPIRIDLTARAAMAELHALPVDGFSRSES